jgi:hypothetical protein
MLAQSVLVAQQLQTVEIQPLLDLLLPLVVVLQVTVTLMVLQVVLVEVLEKHILVLKLAAAQLRVKETLAVIHLLVLMALLAAEVEQVRQVALVLVGQLEPQATAEQVLALILVGV